MLNNQENTPEGTGAAPDRVKLVVLGISYSPMKSGAFAMLLAQEDGPYRIPVVIGAPEAQSIAIKLEGIMTPRPMTHDLFCSFCHAFGVEITEVFIYKFEDGIFSSEMRFSDGRREVTIDSRTSDAVAIALRTGAPIYTTRQILEDAGTILKEGETPLEPLSPDGPARKKTEEEMTLEELEAKLAECINNEEYEKAAKIQEAINKRKNKE